MAKAPKNPRRGRPPIGKRALGEPLSLRFPAEMLEAIDAIVAGRMDRPDRSAVVRELVAEALMARAKRAGR
jgi:Arc/MetJ-type ribon-helix-helix transcriptional regulator